MHSKKLKLALALALLSSTAVLAAAPADANSKKADLKNANDVIAPNSEEAKTLHKSDGNLKTAPKDGSISTGDLVDGIQSSSSGFKKADPKQESHNTLDSPASNEENKKEDKKHVVTSNPEPVVLNDYDPNNLGVSAEDSKSHTATEVKGKNREKEEIKKEDKKDTEINESVSGTVMATDNTNKIINDADSLSNTNLKSTSKVPASFSNTTPTLNQQPSSSFQSFLLSLSMIIVSEIGDKTFLIAALMAMKHSRITVFTAAFASLAIMTVLSAVLGHAVPTFLPKKLTSLIAAILFIIFGVRLMKEGIEMDPNTGVEEELHEVEEEIGAKELSMRDDDLEKGLIPDSGKNKHLNRSNSSPRISQDGLESHDLSDDYTFKVRRRTQPQSAVAFAKSSWKTLSEGFGNLAGFVLSPVWVQVFVMTFLGEWGDRSQIATIVMAAGSDYWFVIIGAIIGHGLCTGVAVIGGRYLATKISLQQITLGGAIAFIIFAILYFYDFYNL